MAKVLSFERSIEDIIEAMQTEKRRGNATTFLIGAGCSVSANIPTAPGFIKKIEEEYKQAYRRACEANDGNKPTYNACMKELPRAVSRQLIGDYVSKAKINWAHIALACLMKEKYVDRVLTSNFDNVLIRACALLGIFPAVYDMTAQRAPIAFADLPAHSIFYLHGQSTGFRLMNTPEELNEHAPHLGPCFNFADGGRTWVVVGYSGGCDPIFKTHIANVETFTHGLHWVYYEPNGLEAAVRNGLLAQNKEAFSVPMKDADLFFCELARQLNCFPPQFVSQPFTYLDQHLSHLTPYPLEGNGASLNLPEATHNKIRQAIEQFEGELESTSASEKTGGDGTLNAMVLLMAQEYEKLTALWDSADDTARPALAYSVVWAYIEQGNALANQARQKTGEEALVLFAQAGEKYQQALVIKPDMHEVLSNWGNALANQARQKTGEEALVLFAQAGEKYRQALAIKPDMHEVLSNWGSALLYQAQQKTGEEADTLFAQAGEKYQQALVIKPDMHEALSNWGNALANQARQKTGEEALVLFAQASEKYQQALVIKPDMHEALYNWGLALANQAQQKTGKEADNLFAQASEKYQQALVIKPDMHDGLPSNR